MTILVAMGDNAVLQEEMTSLEGKPETKKPTKKGKTKAPVKTSEAPSFD